ncbi:MAG: hypothetical protein IPN53_26240 [Comamonadaceae bacterium]|nr:hypothetical protein [Comamonadaceae bacterium]
MHMQADGIDLKAGALGLASPLQVGRTQAAQFHQGGSHGSGVITGQGRFNQLFSLGACTIELQRRVQVRVVAVNGFGLIGGVAGLVDQPDFWIVFAPIRVTVAQHLRLIGLGRLHCGSGFCRFDGWHAGRVGQQIKCDGFGLQVKVRAS